jgi:hypothetical protein
MRSGACSSGGEKRRTCTFTLNANAAVMANSSRRFRVLKSIAVELSTRLRSGFIDRCTKWVEATVESST